MKKKGIATLALAGALAAATMVPAFAATDTTTVGYVAGGNASTNGKVMVTVPKDVLFTEEYNADKTNATSGFDVKAQVWDSTTETWKDPDAGAGLTLGGNITVTVESATGWKLTNKSHTSEGLYDYKVGGTTYENATTSVTTDGAVGTLSDTDATIEGFVAMTKAPVVGQDETAVQFTDTLIFSFTGGDFPAAQP